MSLDETALWRSADAYPTFPPVTRAPRAARPRVPAQQRPAPGQEGQQWRAAPSQEGQPRRAAPGQEGQERRPARVAAPRGTPRHRRTKRERPTRPVHLQPTGPHVRLGIVWAALTGAALVSGPVWLALWLAVVAALAAGTTVRSWATPQVAPRMAHNPRTRVQPPAGLAALFAAGVTLAGLGGGLMAAVAATTAAVAVLAGAVIGPLGRPSVLRRMVLVVGPGVAGACLVVARSQDFSGALVLAGMVTLYDSSAYLIGTGAPNRWEGAVAGMASIAALTLFVAAVLTPPFTGASPWLFGAMAAALAPLGPAIANWLVGDRTAPVPALRRLDSLIVLAPAWVACMALVLHR